jgi:hypothetical protein
VIDELAVQVGVSGENPEQDNAVGADRDDLGDAGICVVVADDQVAPDLDVDTGGGIAEVAIGEATLVDSFVWPVRTWAGGCRLVDHCRKALVGSERGAIARHQEGVPFISFERQQLCCRVVVVRIGQHLLDPVCDHVRLSRDHAA